ncbi:MAG: Negative transcriptional regulator [Pseudobdellovibrio sp.]|nr:Negative transcriptional regulator [Pseudobdellovibrio sp.]
MYIPEYAKSKDDAEVSDLIKRYPFVTLISVTEAGSPVISHVPVVSEFKDGKLTSVKGHLAIKNPHVEVLKHNKKVTVIFHGPHTYITPKWYKSGRDVPTWNYCVVHVTGELKLDSDFRSITKNLAELTKEFEAGDPQPWKFELPEDLKSPEHLTRAIVAFEIIPQSVNGKFKLAQGRPAADQQGVIDGLSTRQDEMSSEVSRLMQKNLR